MNFSCEVSLITILSYSFKNARNTDYSPTCIFVLRNQPCCWPESLDAFDVSSLMVADFKSGTGVDDDKIIFLYVCMLGPECRQWFARTTVGWLSVQL